MMRDEYVCPLYEWANYGTYCDYYALLCPSNVPTNYSTDCGRSAPGCDDYTQCDAIGSRSVLKGTKGVQRNMGVTGYPDAGPGQKKLEKKTKREIIDKVLQNNSDVSSKYITDFVVSFPLPDTSPVQIVYAQVIVARVTPNEPSYPSRFLAGAFEIENPHVPIAIHPNLVLDPVPVLPHAVKIKNGAIEATVILHHGTHSRTKR